MTSEEIQRYAEKKRQELRARNDATTGVSGHLEGLDPVTTVDIPVAASAVRDPFANEVLPPDTSGASGQINAPAPAPAPAPVAQSQMPPAAPVSDGSQEPVHVTNAAPGQRVQTASAFNVAPLTIGARQLEDTANKGADTVLGDVATASKAGMDAADETAKVEGDIANAQAPIRDDHADMEGFLANQQQEIMKQADADTKAHFATLQTYNKEIADHIANQPTDLWGRAGINKVSGIIGLILGGIGASGTGGKNMVVDTIDGMVEQNLKQNQYKYDMLKGKVSAENQAYAQVMQTSQSKQMAADRYRLISNQQFLSQLDDAAQQFAGPQAKARAMALKSTLQMKNAELESKIYGDLNSAHTAAAQIDVARRTQDLQSVQLQAQDKAAKGKEADEQSVPYWDPSDKSHMTAGDATKLRNQQGGAAQVQDILGSMVVSAQAGGIQAVIDNEQGRANLQIALIQQKDLSKRVTEAEAKAMQAMTGFLATGDSAKLLTLMGANTVPEALFKAKQQFAQQHLTNLVVGYGLKPTADNPFVKAATEKYTFDRNADSVSNSAAPTPADGSSDLSQIKSRNEIQQAAAAASARYGQPVSGYGGY